MTSVTLVHPEDKAAIPIHQAINTCSLFGNNPTLTISPYRVQSPVSLSIFKEFVTALEGTTMTIRPRNLIGLEELCKEFGFSEFSSVWPFSMVQIAFKKLNACSKLMIVQLFHWGLERTERLK
jgi:hypothetical protein